MYRYVKGVVRSLLINLNLLQNYYQVLWWKNFENQLLVFGEVRDKSIVAPFCLTVAQFLHCSVYIIIYILLLLSLDHQHHPVYV